MVAARHDGCGAATRVRLPRTVPARAVRRVECAACREPFDAAPVEELPERRRNLASLGRFDPSSRGWQLASLGLGAAAVVGGLLVINGGGGEPGTLTPVEHQSGDARGAGAAAGGAGGAGAAGKDDKRQPKPSKHTQLIAGSTYQLVLPARWEQVDPPAGATFKAVAPDAGADVTLWIQRDPKLSFDEFVSRSMKQIQGLSGAKPEIVNRVPAPTADDSIVTLAATTPPGQPTYQVTLRALGDYRYYLAASVQPDASTATAAGVDLATESFKPVGKG